jgi:6-phosphogluconolactonase
MEEGEMQCSFHRGGKIGRRLFLSFLGLLALWLGAGNAHAASPKKDLVYVGTYTGRGSEGIYGYRFNPATGQLISLGLEAKSNNPSFLAVSPNNKFLYAANETDHFDDEATGAVSAFAIDHASGKLSALDAVSAKDPGPAYVSVDHSGKYVLIANYPLGSVAVYPVFEDGKLASASNFVRHKGSSVNPTRQRGPHAHSIAVSPDNRFALCADLGLDQLIVYPFDAKHGKLGRPRIVKIAPGSGPRHFVFSPNGKFVYLISEMKSTVTVFAYHAANGGLKKLQTVSALPKGFSGKNTAAEIQIAPSGKFLYASNRGDDSIAVFTVDPDKGTLKWLERVPSHGKTPRNFAIDPSGTWLLAANQDSNNIVTFRINKKSGKLTPTGQVMDLSAPVCVQFVPEP